ncbi:hypothetical protein BJ742DRAFT_134912 [Cladochytrium replicatum]|nr:hypothetical protein BJ742DRAFT_134912 [Cladochytrium replicatum]
MATKGLKKFFTFNSTQGGQHPILEQIDHYVSAPAGVEPSWDDLFTVCRLTNEAPHGAEQAFKGVKKALKNTDPVVAGRALELADALIQNCQAFIVELSVEDNIRSIERMITKLDMHPDNQARLVELLDRWEQQCQYPPAKKNLFILLSRLVSSGIDIPRLSGHPNKLPILVAESIGGHGNELSNEPPFIPQRLPPSLFPPPPPALDPETAREMGVPTYDVWREKILSDVQSVQTQAQMLSETLNFVEETENVQTNEIVGELRGRCGEAKERINAILPDVVDDELIMGILVKLSEEIDAAFKLYDDLLERGDLEYIKNVSKAEFDSKVKKPTAVRFTIPSDESAPSNQSQSPPTQQTFTIPTSSATKVKPEWELTPVEVEKVVAIRDNQFIKAGLDASSSTEASPPHPPVKDRGVNDDGEHDDPFSDAQQINEKRKGKMRAQ